MRQHYERVVGYAADIRHCLAAGDERLSTDDRSGDTSLFESDSVVHTAR